MARTADEAANWIIDRLSRSYSLDDEDKDRLRASSGAALIPIELKHPLNSSRSKTISTN